MGASIWDPTDLPTSIPRLTPEGSIWDSRVTDEWPDYGGPKGIFVLNTTDRNTNKLSNLYLAGHTIRVRWNKIQTGPATFDWSLIDDVVPAAQARRQKINLEIFARDLPAFVQADLSEATWADHRGFVTCVAWDENALAYWREFVEILSNHLTPLSTGGTIRLADHPALEIIDAPLVGMQSVRDLAGTAVARPDYSRTKFLNGCIEAVQIIEDYFPDQYKFVGVFPTEDAIPYPRLDLAVVRTLMDKFIPVGETAPKLGFFQELLTDAGPDTTFIGGPMLLARQRTWIMFQALTNWVTPWTGGGKVTSGDCTVGIEYAYEKFGCDYVEIYSKDATDPTNQDDLDTWAGILTDGTHPLSPATVPNVIITEPDAREIISGTFNILVQAIPSGTRTIVQVEFFANGVLIRTDTSFPYGYSWNTALVPDGEYSIEARALDSAGEINSGYMDCVIENGTPKPYIDITDPEPDAEVGSVNIIAYVAGVLTITDVRILINGIVKKIYTPAATEPDFYTYSWAPLTESGTLEGANTISVQATDSGGGVNTKTITVYYFNPFA